MKQGHKLFAMTAPWTAKPEFLRTHKGFIVFWLWFAAGYQNCT